MMVFCLKLNYVKGSHARFQLLAVGRRHDSRNPGAFVDTIVPKDHAINLSERI
jgi:hypothetical protein